MHYKGEDWSKDDQRQSKTGENACCKKIVSDIHAADAHAADARVADAVILMKSNFFFSLHVFDGAG